MKPFSDATIANLQSMTAGMYVDDIEVNPIAEVNDGYNNIIQGFPHSGYIVKGSLQEVVRIPGTPEAGDTTVVTGNFLIKLPVSVILPANGQKVQFVVNGSDTYQTENLYRDKKNRLSTGVYVYRVK